MVSKWKGIGLIIDPLNHAFHRYPYEDKSYRTAVWKLEKAGYIKRRQGRDEKGKMTAIEYTLYEQPQPPDDTPPGLDKPILENPTPGKPTTENPMQLNKDIQRTDLPKKEKIITDEQSTQGSFHGRGGKALCRKMSPVR